MGQTVFSERFSSVFFRQATGAINQSTTWDLVTTDLSAHPSRLLGVTVFSNNGSRVSSANILVRDGALGRELPVWIYDGTNFISTRMQDDGGAVTFFDVLLGNIQATFIPIFAGGRIQPESIPDIAFRGITTAFGAGTVTITALFHVCAPDSGPSGSLSSRGLPIPSW